jgi:hypothetical protein
MLGTPGKKNMGKENGKENTPKMKVDVDSNNKVKLELVNMSKAEQNRIINGTVKLI